jgi:hypothetical protein
MTDGQSVSQSSRQAPLRAQNQIFCYCHTVAVLSILATLSDERTGLSFTEVKISSTCHLYLQFYMSALYIVIFQESGSLCIPTIYNSRVG